MTSTKLEGDKTSKLWDAFRDLDERMVCDADGTRFQMRINLNRERGNEIEEGLGRNRLSREAAERQIREVGIDRELGSDWVSELRTVVPEGTSVSGRCVVLERRTLPDRILALQDQIDHLLWSAEGLDFQDQKPGDWMQVALTAVVHACQARDEVTDEEDLRELNRLIF